MTDACSLAWRAMLPPLTGKKTTPSIQQAGEWLKKAKGSTLMQEDLTFQHLHLACIQGRMFSMR
jgi:hypothetical protein